MNVEHEIGVLIAELTRLGAPNAAHDGKITVRRSCRATAAAGSLTAAWLHVCGAR